MKKSGFQILAAAAAAAMILCGCSDANFGDETFLRPPRATGDEAKIQDIISDQAGGNYSLKYPQRGDNRSAVIMRKSNAKLSDGNEKTSKSNTVEKYAVAMFSTESDSKLNISIIAYMNGKWKCLKTFSNEGMGIDQVVFDDVDSNGTEDIIIGRTAYTGSRKKLSVYSIENETVREITVDDTYNEMVVDDITGDNSNEIVLISLANSGSNPAAVVYKYSEQEKTLMSNASVPIDGEIVEFANVISGKIDKDKKGIILDGKKSGDFLSTQVLYYNDDEGLLVNPLVDIADDGKLINVTSRKDNVVSRDADGDGIIEIPVITQLPASVDENAASICNLTSWNQISVKDDSLSVKMRSIINYNDGYSFVMPNEWSGGNVTALSDAENRQLRFYLWNSSTGSVGDPLLIIYRYTKYEWSDIDKHALIELKELNEKSKNAVFAVQIINTKSDKSLNISEQEVKNCIRLLG